MHEIVCGALRPDDELDDERADELLRAVAHPARRRILLLADRAEVAAGELSAALGLANATTSEHLKVLRKTGLVTLRRQGTWRLYRTDRARLRELERWLARFAGRFADDPDPDPDAHDQEAR